MFSGAASTTDPPSTQPVGGLQAGSRRCIIAASQCKLFWALTSIVTTVIILSKMANDHPPDPPGDRYRTPSPPPAADSFVLDVDGTPNINVELSEVEPSVADDAAKRLERLTMVSMNIAACEPSQSAPTHWSREMSIEAVREEILKTDPDVIALQECPGETHRLGQLFSSHRVVGSTHSHADQVVLLVKNGIRAKQVSVGGARLPAVVAELEWNERRLLVASVHLEPFDHGERKRKMQMKSLLELSLSKSTPLFVMGDTNMRDREDDAMENELGLLDVWKLAGSDPGTRFTWDTIDHRGGVPGGAFNRYYGDRTRQYQRRYDRIYASTANDAVEFATPPSFALVANRPMTSDVDFLSDHFGMSASVQLGWKGK